MPTLVHRASKKLNSRRRRRIRQLVSSRISPTNMEDDDLRSMAINGGLAGAPPEWGSGRATWFLVHVVVSGKVE